MNKSVMISTSKELFLNIHTYIYMPAKLLKILLLMALIHHQMLILRVLTLLQRFISIDLQRAAKD